MEDEIPLNPVTAWIAEPIKAYEAITLRLSFISGPMQDPAHATDSPYFLLSAGEAEKLARKILAECERLKTSEFQSAPGPKH